MSVTVGSSATESFTVSEADTAISLGSGDVSVLATPRMIAWCEAMTVQAIADQLGDGQTTVGYKIRVDHLAPTLVGSIVRVTATVSEVDRSMVTFDVQVDDGKAEDAAVAARGTITRVIVDRADFMARASAE